jgi:bifunctional non-homologous end joining protein LigD
MPKADLLKTYRAKRDFSKTTEPSGEDQGESKSRHERVFVIQKH